MTHDYGDHEEETAPDQLALLGRLVEQLKASAKGVENAELDLKAAQEKFQKLREVDIPELMLSIGLKDLTTASGIAVTLREEVRASLPKAGPARLAAFQWLRDNDHAGLIKTEIKANFNREQLAAAEAVMTMIREYSKENDLSFKLDKKEDVHHQTLCAFLREQMRAGANVPLEVFGAFVQKFAEIG